MHPGQLGSAALLRRARAGLDRLTPRQALAEQECGALLIDIRTDTHRAETAWIPTAVVIDLTVLPWRLDPAFEHHAPEASGWDLRCILLCRHGYSSSLAAWNLQQMGLHRATDVLGGFDAWVAAGLPTSPGPAVPPT